MRLAGETALPGARQEVWNRLVDPHVMAQCLPGCQEVSAVGPDTYAVTLKIGVGPITGTYGGTMRITEQEAPNRYRVAFEGVGAQGFVRGTGQAQLAERDGSTVLHYESDIQVGGLVASVGQRVLEGVGKLLLRQMFAKLSAHVAQGERP
jgi:carbon monoxide dehydrogenase subunit G